MTNYEKIKEACPICGGTNLIKKYCTEFNPVGLGTIQRLQSVSCADCKDINLKEIIIKFDKNE